MPLCNKLILAAIFASFLAAEAPILAADQAPPRPGLASLTPEMRRQIDSLAMRAPQPGLPTASVDFSGNIVAWLISQAMLSPEEEAQAAEQNHEHLLRQFRVAPTPPEAAEVFEKLLAALPPHLKPEAFTYRLTVLESDSLDAATAGGGYVYLTQPLVEALLAGGPRGRAALALTLGSQLGHIALKHCRRGYQLAQLEEETRGGRPLPVDERMLRRAWETGIERRDSCLRFLYLRDEIYEADLFAMHLCRNAGFDVDASLDALRWRVLLSDPELQPLQPASGEEQAEKPLEDYLSSPPELARRLQRLLLEQTGQALDEAAFGLFSVDVACGKLTKAPAKTNGRELPALIFVHGFAGKETTFENFFRALNETRAIEKRRILFFRYPNNGSLAAAGEMLAREMTRAVAAPEQAVFICHSAGGLAFRYYAEKKKGAFDRAIFLGVPHGGTELTELKFLVDAGTFFRDLKFGLPEAIQRAINEGTRQVTHDLHPDSLFLRYLGADAAAAPRYRIYCGQVFNTLESLGLGAVIDVARELLDRQAVERIARPRLRSQLGSLVEHLRLPEEIAEGDLIVSVASANLPGVADVEIVRLNHLQLTSDLDLIGDVLADLFAEPDARP